MDLATDAQGVFWLATGEGLFRYAPSTWLKPAPLRELEGPVESMAEDSAGRFWLLETNCLHEMQRSRWQAHPLPEWVAKNLRGKPGLFPMVNGNIVISGGDELMQYQPKTEKFEVVQGRAGKRLKALGMFRKGVCVQELPMEGKTSMQLAVFDGDGVTDFPCPSPSGTWEKPVIFLRRRAGILVKWRTRTGAVSSQGMGNICASQGSVPEAALCLAEISNGENLVRHGGENMGVRR